MPSDSQTEVAADDRPETGSRLNLTLDVTAALLLTVSVTMLADFTRRLLGSDPDSFGILAISIQAMFAVAATSTFTSAGWSWLEGLWQLLGMGIQDRARWRFGLSLLLAGVVITVWYVVPGWLASYYNARGLEIYENNRMDSAEALRDYQRAIALNPEMHQPYVNLGGLMEDYYRYGEAAEQYRRGITAGYGDPTPYNNLARVLLLSGDSLTALRIADAALGLKPTAEVKSALLKNRAWAELNLGFTSQAIADAKQSNSAAGECILGKVYIKLGKTEAAREAWNSFEQMSAATSSGPAIEPDCQLFAEKSHETK
jgi:hypothetical protein